MVYQLHTYSSTSLVITIDGWCWCWCLWCVGVLGFNNTFPFSRRWTLAIRFVIQSWIYFILNIPRACLQHSWKYALKWNNPSLDIYVVYWVFFDRFVCLPSKVVYWIYRHINAVYRALIGFLLIYIYCYCFIECWVCLSVCYSSIIHIAFSSRYCWPFN